MSNNRNRYLAKNIAIFTLGNFGPKVVTFFLVPLYTSVMNTSEYGVVDLINTVAMIAIPFLILNISESIMRFSLDKNSDYNKIMSIGIFICFLSIVISIPFIGVIVRFDGMRRYAYLIYFYTISLGMLQIFLSYLRGKEKLLEFSIGNIIQITTIAFFSFLFLYIWGLHIEGYLLSYILANVVTCFYVFWIGDIWDVIKNFSIDKKLTYEMIRYSIFLVPNSFMWWIINSSDRIMVTAMLGAAANGIYAISYKIPSMIQILSNVFNQAWTYSAIRESSSADKDIYSNKIYYGLSAMALISGVAILSVIKPFLYYYVGIEYYNAWMYTPFLIVGYVFITMGSFLATFYTVYKDSKGFLISGCCGAIINILLNFILIPYFGITGAAMATAISYLVVFIYRAIDTRKYIRIDVFGKRHILATGVLVLASGTVFINSIYGQILLIIELTLQIYIFSDYWLPLLKSATIKISNRIL